MLASLDDPAVAPATREEGKWMKEWYEKMLKQPDDAAKNYRFPTFNNVNLPAGGLRLFSYRDDGQWLLVFETIEYSVDERRFFNSCILFGNDVDQSDQHVELEILRLPPDQGTRDDEIEHLLQQEEITVMIRNKPVKVTLDAPPETGAIHSLFGGQRRKHDRIADSLFRNVRGLLGER